MKLISWNVNGLRAALGRGFAEFFREAGADYFCLQETKMQPGQAEVDTAGYEEFWNSAIKKGYAGTAVFARKAPLSVVYGIGVPAFDGEGRVITLEAESFYLVNCYTPNAQRELLRLAYRMLWEDAFRVYLETLDRQKPVILCGDLNVAHTEMDIKNAKSNVNNAGFTLKERKKMTALLGSGFVDTFRHLHPEARDAYTWWSYMAGVRERNIGWRIDYFIVSQRVAGRIVAAEILSEVMGSDHCPVALEIDL